MVVNRLELAATVVMLAVVLYGALAITSWGWGFLAIIALIAVVGFNRGTFIRRH